MKGGRGRKSRLLNIRGKEGKREETIEGAKGERKGKERAR